MTRKSFLFALGIVLFLVGGSVGTLLLLVRSVPESYEQAHIPPGPQRVKYSKEFTREVVNAAQHGKDREWAVQLTDKQINSFFAEHFVNTREREQLLPESIREPRIMLEKDKIRLGFRYREGFWSTVITLDFRLWLPKEGEPNVIAMELQGIQAGRLPINAQSLLKEITNATRDHNIAVKWYRYEGNPVALIRFQADQPHSTIQLERVTVKEGKLIIQGKPVGGSRVASIDAPMPEELPELRR